MTAMSDYLENVILNSTLRGQVYTAPSTVYLALYTSDPTDADRGTEVSGGGYVRKAITFNAPVDGSAVQSADVLFPAATVNWGTVTHIGILDALTGGNLLYHVKLATAKTINASDQLRVRAGDITVTIT
jgi:hypothetical protein